MEYGTEVKRKIMYCVRYSLFNFSKAKIYTAEGFLTETAFKGPLKLSNYLNDLNTL